MSLPQLFTPVLAELRAPQDPRISLLIWWAARFAELGFTPSYGQGDHGNLSCRTPMGLLITASQTEKSSLRADQLVEVMGMDSSTPKPTIRCRGLLPPSTDALMHLLIYQRRPDVQAILHGHDNAALGKAQELNLPVTEHSAKTASMELVQDVCGLAGQYDYLLMRDHGFLALGKSVDDAGELARQICARARSLAS